MCDKQRLSVTFHKNHATINPKDGSIALKATEQGQLYIVNETKEIAFNVCEQNNLDVIKWHQRYGHINLNDLKKIVNEKMVSGINFEPKVSNVECEVCAKCKIHVLPFSKSENCEKEVLALKFRYLWSDECCISGGGGAKYFITFIDDASRYIEIVVLQNRSEVIQAFKNYKRKVEKQTGKSIKKIHTDNGKEYLSKQFNAYLEEKGITRQLTVKYTPQQNGADERENHTIVEMARYMIFKANFPNSLWAEMVNTAVYLRNRSATKSLEGKTPFEAWTNKNLMSDFLEQ